MVMEKLIEVPADVPTQMQETYIENYRILTQNTGRLMMFSCDQKIEHLNNDFYDADIAKKENCGFAPLHFFEIARKANIGAVATQLGLIARYGKEYESINYIAKLNSKTNLIKTKHKDPISSQLWTLEDVGFINENTKIKIRGVGYTVYLGSEFEHVMLTQAAQIIFQAHQYGLIAILWIYPRGKHVGLEDDIKLVAGAAGVANALGADFAKIKAPTKTRKKSSAELLKIAVQAAGNTKILCSGGQKVIPKKFLEELYEQIHIGGTAGNATGRNIFQHKLHEAIAMADAIAAIVYDNKSVDEAMAIFNKAKK